MRFLARILLLLAAVQAGASPCVFYENSLEAPHRPEGGAVEVDIHLYLNDLIEIKDAEQSFVSDVFFRADWVDLRLVHSGSEPCSVNVGQIWNPGIQLMNRRIVDRVNQPDLTVAPDGKVRQVLRAYGDFSFQADLTDFPFDSQKFGFVLVSSHEIGEVHLIAEPNNLGMAEQLSVANWQITTAGSRAGEYYIAPVNRHLSRLDVLFQADRLTGFYTWQLLVPLFLVVMMTWTVFWMPLEFVAPRVGLVATSMLTLIAYRFSMTSILPPIAYLTRLDVFMVASSILVFGALAAAVLVAYLEGRGSRAQAVRLNYVSRWLAPGLFLAVFAKVFMM